MDGSTSRSELKGAPLKKQNKARWWRGNSIRSVQAVQADACGFLGQLNVNMHQKQNWTTLKRRIDYSSYIIYWLVTFFISSFSSDLKHAHRKLIDLFSHYVFFLNIWIFAFRLRYGLEWSSNIWGNWWTLCLKRSWRTPEWTLKVKSMIIFIFGSSNTNIQEFLL